MFDVIILLAIFSALISAVAYDVRKPSIKARLRANQLGHRKPVARYR